jgi:hypothetical protein
MLDQCVICEYLRVLPKPSIPYKHTSDLIKKVLMYLMGGGSELSNTNLQFQIKIQ